MLEGLFYFTATGRKRIRYIGIKKQLVGLGGLVVIVLVIGPKFRGFKPGRGRCSLKCDKSLSCRKILRHVKEPCEVRKRCFVGKIHDYFSPSFSPFHYKCLCCFLPEILEEESGIIRTQMGKANRSENGRSDWDALFDNTP
jgi:hypothetical protein